MSGARWRPGLSAIAMLGWACSCGPSGELTVNDQQLKIVDVQYASVGVGGGVFADLVQLELEGNVVLVLQFLAETSAGDTITIAPVPDADEGAYVINYLGFEGGPQDLCDRNGQNGATSGSFDFEQLERDATTVTHVCGSLELTFTGCDFSKLGIAGDVSFSGSFCD